MSEDKVSSDVPLNLARVGSRMEKTRYAEILAAGVAGLPLAILPAWFMFSRAAIEIAVP